MQSNLLFLFLTAAFFCPHVLARPNIIPVNNDVITHSNTTTAGLQPRQSQVGDQVLKHVYACGGYLNGFPNYDCPPDTCNDWYRYLGPDVTEIEISGVNFIDTDCHTDFKVCNQHGHCKDRSKLTPSQNVFSRCSWAVPGTESLYVWNEP